MRGMQSRTSRGTPPAPEEPGKRMFRTVVLFSIGVIAVMIIASAITFFLTIEGEEQTLVPDVRGMELASAMIDLQQKGLVGEVLLRVSANPADKGTVLGQEPNPGTLVKVGRAIELRVSKGPIIDEVESYVGMQLSELRLQIQSMSTIYGALLEIEEPVMEVYDEAPRGTILEQSPEAGTKITELTRLQLVVSRGPQGGLITIPDYTGLGFYEALRTYAEMDAPFIFYSRVAEADEDAGVVVSQSPDAGADVEEGTLVQFTITTPEIDEENEDNLVFGIHQRQLPDYPTPIMLFIEVESPTGETRELASMNHPGGIIAIPYLEPAGSKIIVSSSLRTLFTYEIQEPEE